MESSIQQRGGKRSKGVIFHELRNGLQRLEINVKNDEQLVKLATVVQRLKNAELKGSSESEFALTEEEKSQLLGSIKDTVEELQDKSDFLSNELDDKSDDISKRLGK